MPPLTVLAPILSLPGAQARRLSLDAGDAILCPCFALHINNLAEATPQLPARPRDRLSRCELEFFFVFR